MSELIQNVQPILTKYMSDATVRIEAAITLGELGIDALDLPMIALDVEDVFAVAIGYDEDMNISSPVAALIACIERHLAAKAAGPVPRSAPRRKSGWMSTGAGR